MVASPIVVFDSSPLVASCPFSVGGVSVAALVIAGAQVWIPPAVYNEVISRGGTRPDALEAARLVHQGRYTLQTRQVWVRSLQICSITTWDRVREKH